ncbi:MAG: DsbA family protein [Patescibacteria group bacterium UBA2103]
MNQGMYVAGAIIVGGGLIAGSIIYTNNNNNNGAPQEEEVRVTEVREIGEGDHTYGNPNAPVQIIEYSDFECPFCARFHPTPERIVEESDGGVVWAYRHFPLNIHRNAPFAAEASECAAKLGGNNAFWSYSEGLFENQNRLGDALYLELAEVEGIDVEAFNACLASDRHIAKVEAEFNEALAAGARGTPYNIVIGPDGTQIPFSGALPYETVLQIIESL